jgi:PAS domain S-box-containing protein
VQREKRFRALIENISDAIVMNDEHSNILYQSPSVAKILGYSDNERIGKKVLDYVHPKNRNEFLQLYQNLYESPNLPLPFEYRFLHKNGNYIWLEGVVTNMLHNPAVKAFVANYRDITQRKESEEKLIASEKQFRYTLDHMLEGIQIIGFDWRYKYVNDAMAKHGRYLKEAFIGHTVMEMYPGIEHTKIYRIYQRCFNERIPIHLENEFEFPDKSTGWFELSFQPVPEGIFILSVDITERKKAEAQHDLFSFIVNSSDDAIISKSVNGTITSWNNGAASLFGYSEKEAIGKNITMLLPPELIYEEQQIMEKIDKGEYVRHYETERLKKDGTRMNISLTVSPVRNKFGEIVGASKIARDITEQKNAERQKEFDQNNLNALINNTKDLMWSVDRNYRLITSNQAFDKLVAVFSGSSPVKGSEIIQGRITNDDFQKYKGYYDRAFSGETFTEIEHYNTPFEFWSEISFYPIYDGNQVIGTACFSRNITDHKNAAEKLRLSNERYEAVSKATSDAIWDYDYLTGKTFIAGTGYKYLFGYPVINDYCEPLFWESRLHPEDKKRVLAELDEILADKEIRQSALEYRFLKASGSYAYVNDRFFIFRKDGKPVRILGAKQDITIRKIAEDTLTNNLNEKKVLAERLTTILNTLPANIALLNEKGVILDVNEIWKKFADNNGYTGNNYNIGDNYLEISKKSFGEEKSDGQKVASGIKDVLTNKKKEFVYEYPCHSSKVKRWFRMVVTPLKGKDYLGAIVMHIDISEIRRLEQERLKLKMEEQKKITDAMLKGQEKERNAIGIELHDNVNQILAGTNMLLSLINLQPEKSTSLIPSCIDNITQAIQENRKISHELVTPDLSTESLLEQIFRLSQTMLQSAGIKVIIDNTDFTESLLNNEQKLTIYRLSQEQCTNIIKYSGAKRVNFTLTTKDKQFKMQITDNGKGANIEKSKNGIGLKNINSRLSILNGTLYIATKPGNGFTLSVQIPLDVNEKK